ncbi:MAG: phosphoenolpyruvate carboxykinase (GTP) [Spirochaetales bacterium]|uniref:Phosphoenolpyruvate carboxykinase [GTP] n=1 Tax=Candidatus Thalassospirochaeta sargassi TaxID=3119039 RepID=A0AAJ1I9W2_9SPIO|nr:phosphoenolpyruvate carboxykinase (GTP) [Spirochaetales bacterium]
MLEMKKGIDILADVGGVADITAAKALFESKLDKSNLAKINTIKNEDALLKIANAIAMCEPDDVFIIDDSREDAAYVKQKSIETGEEKNLSIKDHTIHYDLPEDQGRLVNQTFYIVNEGEDISSIAKKELRADSHKYIKENMKGIMHGLTMYVSFLNRGPVGAQASIPALMITSSTYVQTSGDLLYRNVFKDFDAEAERCGTFFTNVHSQGPGRSEDVPKAKIYMDRSWQTCFSTFCTYAGNTLLLKKGNHRFAVDRATYYKVEEELSEHMFLTGMTGPGGRKTFFAGAAPSGCGKTTTAMVGTDFIGDDLCQMWIDEKTGSVRGINPEAGIFGIVADVNYEGDPHLMPHLRNEGATVIFTNVLIDETNNPHWTGDGDPVPARGVNFQGEWFPGKKDADGKEIPVSHPNARCTILCDAIDNYNPVAAEDPTGVHVQVVTYSGRDSDTMPPVWVAKTMDEGVAIGASIVSAATATEVGVAGVRRQPWANAPFIPGALGDYMDAQFKFFNSSKITKKPIMAGLNYFLTEGSRGGEGKKLLGEKKDVKVWLGWLELRANGDVDAIETPIGFIPLYEDLKKLFEGISKPYPRDLYDRQFSFYIDNIVARLDLQDEAFKKDERVPEKIFKIYAAQKAELLALKEKYGAIVSVEKLAEAAN